MPDYDAIVCGGSFAGLAAASQIGGRVLVIDSQDIGEGETSASAVPLECLERLDLLDCVEQVHPDIVLHTRRRDLRMHFFPFATFSYSRFCTDLAARTGADILRARIWSAGAGVVDTGQGRLTAPIIIEAAGWRTSGTAGGDPDDVRPPRKSFGIEARQPFRGGDGLHFYVGPSLGRRRFYWAFPAGDHVRAGIAAYDGHAALGRELQPFLDGVGLGSAGAQHGGFFTSRLGEPVRDDMFVVGDAAGHCLPVSGEGIRPALVFGQVAGRLAERVRLGEMTLQEGLRRHRAFVESRRRAYAFLDGLQSVLNRTPDPLYGAFAALVARPRVLRWRGIIGMPPIRRCSPPRGPATRCLRARFKMTVHGRLLAAKRRGAVSSVEAMPHGHCTLPASSPHSLFAAGRPRLILKRALGRRARGYTHGRVRTHTDRGGHALRRRPAGGRAGRGRRVQAPPGQRIRRPGGRRHHR